MPNDAASPATPNAKYSTRVLLSDAEDCIRELGNDLHEVALRDVSGKARGLAMEIMQLTIEAAQKLHALQEETAPEQARDADYYGDREYAVSVGK